MVGPLERLGLRLLRDTGDWPLFPPIRSKPEPIMNRWHTRQPCTWNFFQFWLAHWLVCVLCDWTEWWLRFWFYDTQFSAALAVAFHLLPHIGGFSLLSIFVNTTDIICSRFGRKKPLVYCMIIAAIASAGAVLFTMYDPGQDKGRLVTIHL